MLDEAVEFQRKIEDEAKQKRLAEQNKDVGSCEQQLQQRQSEPTP